VGHSPVAIVLEEVLPENKQIDNFEVEHVFEKIGPKTMLLNVRKILRADNEMILLVIQDITERKLFEEQRNQLLTQEQSARSDAEVTVPRMSSYQSSLTNYGTL